MTNYYPPPIYEDETIYSYVARLHLYWVESNHRCSAKRWFGKVSISVDQRLPIGLKHFSEKTGYATEHLLNNHSFYPLFSAFCGKPLRLKKTMLSNNGANLGNISNVSQANLSGLGKNKYCLACIEEDKEKFGIAYWHLTHQMHGVTCCVSHGLKLYQTPTTPRLYTLPPQTCLGVRECSDIDAMGLTLNILKYWCAYSHPDTREDFNDIFKSPPKSVLSEKGLLKGKYVDMERIKNELDALTIKLFGKKLITSNVLHNIIKKHQYPCHPLKPILINYAILRMPQKDTSKTVTQHHTFHKRDDYARCVKLLESEVYSMRHIAKQLNRSVGYVKRIAMQVGAYFDRRIQFITFDIQTRIIKAAKKGEHRFAIAKREQVSVGAVERLIEGVAGLSAFRHKVRMQKRKMQARKNLKRQLKSKQNITRSDLKSAMSADYMWLYKHDKEWLYKHLPKAQNHTKL